MALVSHLGHPGRFYEILLTPQTSSAMAMFGFVYAWYLMAVLLLEIWFVHRTDMIGWAEEKTGVMRFVYRALALFSRDTSARGVEFDHKALKTITIIGIPSAFLLHGYVGFIFGSVKANPWWSTPLMPIVFLFSAIVSGIALVMLVYMLAFSLKGLRLDMGCLDTIARYLLYAFIIDFALEMLDLVHRIYEADESFKSLDFMVHTRLYTSQIVLQIGLGTLLPIALLALAQIVKLTESARRGLYVLAGLLTLVGIFAMRWNVVIGGQLFSKSFLGYTTYKMGFATREGLLPSLALLVLPLLILWGLVRLLPPWPKEGSPVTEASA
jgi:Ni/Fe-hydrogenase subunit HybB-like protein